MRDGYDVRLGGLAANLARVSSFSDNDHHQKAVEGLLEESKYFIEWCAGEAHPEESSQLVDLQVKLARWQYKWSDIWPDKKKRNLVAKEANEWSQRILLMSGLLKA
jgi:hypothetical protein